MSQVVMVYSDQSIYDGWSVARMLDGRLVNRWPHDDPRHAPTEAYIASIKRYEDEHNAPEDA
jgi:hypothetical protein